MRRICLLFISILSISSFGQKAIVGAAQLNLYLPMLQNQKIALMVNQTSVVEEEHLVDLLIKLNVNISKIFVPEHGFRGDADAGEHISNTKDAKTGIPLISLFGNIKKPTPEMLKDVDIIIFDIQDVGARFYTYISSMHYLMEACSENNKKMIVLDRPNPNNYIDGPVLKKGFESFVGMHPIPIVHGCTVGELALMINGEKWLKGDTNCQLTVIPLKNYSHKDSYSLPIKPSPNLPNDASIQFYPYLCLFEGTNISVGRGTDKPFQQIGAPNSVFGKDSFKPISMNGATNPPHKDKVCYGIDLTKLYPEKGYRLRFLLEMYQKSPSKDTFFNNFFNKLAGNAELKKQIISGMSEEAIRNSWQKDLNNYKLKRKKYLLYTDFE